MISAREAFERARRRYPRLLARLRESELAEQARQAVAEPEGIDLGPLSHKERLAVLAQRIEARSDETLQAARPEGREPDGEADAPTP